MTETLTDPVLFTTYADFPIYRRNGRQTIRCVMPACPATPKSFTQQSSPDGTTDSIYGFDSREEAAEWIEIERRSWLRDRRRSA